MALNSGRRTADSSAASAGIGIALLLSSLVCLGTWPAILRLCTHSDNDRCGNKIGGSRGCTSSRILRRLAQDRHPCHAYVDYSLAYALFSLTVPVLLGHALSSGGSAETDDEGSNNSDASHSLFESWPLIAIASLGGALLSVGNMTTQWSTAVFNAPLTTVLALQASMTVTIGTTVNYALEPDRTGRPALLAWGVLAFLGAIGLSVRAQHMYGTEKRNDDVESDEATNFSGQEDLDVSMRPYLSCDSDRPASSETVAGNGAVSCDAGEACGSPSQSAVDDAFVDNDPPTSKLTPLNISAPAGTSSLHATAGSMSTGTFIAFGGGLCFGFFSPAINIATNDPFGWVRGGGADRGDGDSSGAEREGSGLSIPTANACFALAFAVSSVAYNSYIMRIPPQSVMPSTPPTTMRHYLSEQLSNRRLALVAGTICALGNVLQFHGGRMSGYATSDLVQAFPLVATIWDIVVLGEFRTASRRVVLCLFGMYLSYGSGMALLAASIR